MANKKKVKFATQISQKRMSTARFVLIAYISIACKRVNANSVSSAIFRSFECSFYQCLLNNSNAALPDSCIQKIT